MTTAALTPDRRHLPVRRRNRGLTLIELLVSMLLLGLVTVATVALYSVNSSAYRTVDSDAAMQDTARFIFDQVGRAARNAGFRDVAISAVPTVVKLPRWEVFKPTGSVDALIGFDNSLLNSTTTVGDDGGNDRGGVNLSDTVAFKFVGVSTDADVSVADGSMVTCLGRAIPYPSGAAITEADLGISLFVVGTHNGEPELKCVGTTNGGATARETQPIARGVETFQVVYGFDSNPASDTGMPTRWVQARDITATQWPQVRAVRVGFVLRGAPGTSQFAPPTAAERTYYPLGKEFVGSSPAAGHAFVAPADSRLRRAYTATYLLRNSQL